MTFTVTPTRTASRAESTSIIIFVIVLLLPHNIVRAGCPFQNPFWFVEKPMVVPVRDENDRMLPDKLRVMWGRMENFKCVDYFQVEYFQRTNPASTVQMTARINRHRRSVEIDVIPCTDYYFKVIASEDWKGMREDFKMFSEVVSYKLEYTPQFITDPIVKERRRFRAKTPEERRRAERRREQRQMQQDSYGMMASDDASIGLAGQDGHEQEDEFLIKVGWRLSDIDYPICLDHFVVEYFDTLYNETGFSRSFHRPFHNAKFELEVDNTLVPCEVDYEFTVRAFGFNGLWSTSYWTPPSCVVTTPAPTTSTEEPTTEEPEETTPDMTEQMEAIREENERLQMKIDGLKQEYEKIGLQVFHAFKESFFQGLEDFLARRKSEQEGLFGGVGGNGLELNNNTEAALFG